jgi:hypothetical protein
VETTLQLLSERTSHKRIVKGLKFAMGLKTYLFRYQSLRVCGLNWRLEMFQKPKSFFEIGENFRLKTAYAKGTNLTSYLSLLYFRT